MPLGGVEGEDKDGGAKPNGRGGVCEDQEEGCHWQKEGRRVREMREDPNERRREEDFGYKKWEKRKYSEK